MGQVVRSWWASDLSGIGIPKRDRLSCWYEAYVPDTLSDRNFTFDGSVTTEIVEAEREIHALDRGAVALVDTEALARLLLRAESVASSKIEGLEISPRRLLRADAARRFDGKSTDLVATEVLANVDAMAFAADAVRGGDAITLQILCEVHRRLLEPTRPDLAGRPRTAQNWIGGSDYNPCNAAFVPPPPEHVIPLLNDLCAFCNEEALPAVAQAAIAHAQFETIHPFADGNGRVGRALIHMVLRRRRLVARVLPPVSLVLATWAKTYVSELMATRYLGGTESPEARDGANRWVAFFGSAARRAVHDAMIFEERIQDVETGWRTRLGSVRTNSATDLLLKKLPGAPIITVQSAAELIDRSFQAANEAVSRLVGAAILVPSRAVRRNRSFEARDIIDTFTELERRLASPDSDTKTSPPERRVPYRPQRGSRKRSTTV